MRFRVVITARAEIEMREAARWWADEHSPEQAQRWLAGLDEQLQSLSSSPARCPLAVEHGQFRFELRELHYGLGRRATHRAIFTIAQDMVLVLAVRHGARDQLRPEDIP